MRVKQAGTLFEEPTVLDLMPERIEHYLCDTLLNHCHDVGHEHLLFALRKYAPYASSSVVHNHVKVERVAHHVFVGRDRYNSAPVESAAVWAPARLRQRCGAAACTVRAAEITQHVVQPLRVQ